VNSHALWQKPAAIPDEEKKNSPIAEPERMQAAAGAQLSI
jgi:hypothetical protein